MRLTAYTDYSLRTLMYLALNRGQLATIQEIADFHGIAKNHLTKVVHQLGMLGYVTTIRGRKGGLRLAREPSEINIGEVVRHTETDFHMASCFDPQSSGCTYSAACALQAALGNATSAFLAVLDALTLEQMLVPEERRPESTASRRPQAVPLHFKRAV
jgi:Rrf2 family transcriptional regulator, nitric oxide-sensitive transcriptional repressor